MESTRPDAQRESGPASRAGLLLAALSGVLHVLALPPFDRGWLAFVALVPLLVAVHGEPRPMRRLALGAVFGGVSVAGTIHWLPAALVAGNGFGPRSALIVSVLVMAAHTAFFALLPVLIGWLDRGWLSGALAPPVAWVTVEALRDAAMPALAWTAYGHSQHATLPVLQLAEGAGVPGVGFVLVLVNALLADVWVRVRATGWSGRVAIGPGIAVAIVTAVVVFGSIRLAAEDRAEREAGSAAFEVAAVHLAIPQSDRWQPDTAWPRIEALLAMSKSAAERGARLVVWPETAVEVHLDKAQELEARVADALAAHPGTKLLVGAPREEVDGHGSRFYNSAALLGARGDVLGLYDKVQLYPVSEYLPGWLMALPGATRVFASQLRWEPYSPGAPSQALIESPVPTGILICAEGIGSRAARERAAAGAELLVHLANDAVIPGWAAAAQHFAIVRFRAVESRRPLVRASNRGVTAVVAASGRVLESSASDEPGLVVSSILPRSGTTAHMAVGWMLPGLCIAASIVGGLTRNRRRACSGASRRSG